MTAGQAFEEDTIWTKTENGEGAKAVKTSLTEDVTREDEDKAAGTKEEAEKSAAIASKAEAIEFERKVKHLKAAAKIRVTYNEGNEL